MAMMMAALLVAASAGPAWAVDPPKWVAAVYMAAQNAVGLRWNPVPGATGYKVLRSMAKGKDYAEIYSGAQPQFFDKSVEPADTYFYVLQAVDSAGVSANSDEKSVQIPGEKKRALNPPDWDQFGLTETTEFGKTTYKIGLSWKKSDNPDVVAYNLLRSNTKGKDYQQIWSGTDTKYVDADKIEEGKTYYYVLTVLDNAFQESRQSAEKEQLVKKAEKVAGRKAEVKNTIVVKASKTVFTIPTTPEEPLMGMPTDMVIDRDARVTYLMSQNPNVVMIYNEDGSYKGQFGVDGPLEGQFQLPTCMALDKDGNIYVSDLARKKIIIFDGRGTYKREFSTTKKCKPEDAKDPMVTGIAVDADGTVYGADNNNGHVMVFTDGKLERCFAEQATQKERGIGFVSKPGGMIIDAKGRLHLQDYGPSRTQIFDPKTGTALFSLGENVKGLVGSFVKVGKPFPDDKNKLIWGLDSAMGNIQAFDYETGDYRFTLVGEDKKLKFNERADWPITSTRAMDVDSKGIYWVMLGMERSIVGLQMLEPLQ
jgi:sugar lactone lactonase YvrE/fibronectin type 3 domain-containing protein